MKKLSLFLILFSIGFISFAQKGRTLSTAKEIEQRGEQFRVPATADQNFIAQDVNGNTWNLYELLDEGKYVMLDFDYTDWPYCPDRVSDLNTAYNTYGCNSHDVIILNLTSDSQSQAQSTAQSEGKEYPVLGDGADGGYSHYCTSGVPGSILIAPNKNVVNNSLYPATADINAAFSLADINEFNWVTGNTLNAKFSANNTEININDTVIFTDESEGFSNTITSWEWTFEGGNPSTFNGQNPPAITYAHEGTFNVKLVVSNSLDTTEELKNDYIYVDKYCSARATYTPNTSEYISNVTLGTINKTSQSSGYSNFTSENTEITTTPITATITITNPFQSDKLYAWIDWNKDGDFDDDEEQVCNKSASSSPVTFEVIAPTFLTTNDNGSTRMRIRLEDYENNGNETPCGVSAYGEVEDYTLDLYLGCININNISNNTFTIYPNPNNGVFNIVTTNNASNKITITDISGKLVYENNTNTNNILVDLNNVNKGIYFVKIFNEAGVKIEKIIIK